MLRRVLALALLAVSVFAAAPDRARAGLEEIPLDWLIERTARVPACDDPAVVADIRDRFLIQTRVVHQRLLGIVDVEEVREKRHSVNDPSPIERRWCQAHARLDDGKHPQLYYLIERRAGFVGITWNVEFCLAGYDRWHVHDGQCRAVRVWW